MLDFLLYIVTDTQCLILPDFSRKINDNFLNSGLLSQVHARALSNASDLWYNNKMNFDFAERRQA
jgi:hypothetical protein